jgi:hypothetical protein
MFSATSENLISCEPKSACVGKFLRIKQIKCGKQAILPVTKGDCVRKEK